MDFTFKITNQDKLISFFSVVKTMDFKQMREAIEKVEKDMEELKETKKRIREMSVSDVMWDGENKRIKIKINKLEQWESPEETYCANLGMFNGLIIDACGLKKDYIEYGEFNEIIKEYIEQENLGNHPSVMILIDGLVETLRKKYDVKFQNFKQIEELQKIGKEYREMHAWLLVGKDAKGESNAITYTGVTRTETDIDER